MSAHPVIIEYSISPNQHYAYFQYRLAMAGVFRSLRFWDKTIYHVLYDSYMNNLRHLVLYAIEHDIDEIEYIKSIRNILLQNPTIHARY